MASCMRLRFLGTLLKISRQIQSPTSQSTTLLVYTDSFHFVVRRQSIRCTGSQDCHNELPHAWQLINNRNLFSHTSGGQKSKNRGICKDTFSLAVPGETSSLTVSASGGSRNSLACDSIIPISYSTFSTWSSLLFPS